MNCFHKLSSSFRPSFHSQFIESKSFFFTSQQRKNCTQLFTSVGIQNFGIPIEKLQPLTDMGFAIVHIGGTQHKLMKGDVVMAQKVEAPIGSEILFQKVLMVGTKNWTAFGTPLLQKARVHAVVEEQTKTKKVIVFKKKRRKNYVRHNTHRQPFSMLRIKDIFFDPSENFLDFSNALDKETVLNNVTTHPLPPIERVPPPPTMLSATKLPTPAPFPSTANPLPTWDKKLIQLNEKKAAERAERLRLEKEMGTIKPLKKEIKKGELNQKAFLMRKKKERAKMRKKNSFTLPTF